MKKEETTISITSYNEHYVKLRYPGRPRRRQTGGVTGLGYERLHVFCFCGEFCSVHSFWLEALKFWSSHRPSHRVKNTAIIKEPIIAK